MFNIKIAEMVIVCGCFINNSFTYIHTVTRFSSHYIALYVHSIDNQIISLSSCLTNDMVPVFQKHVLIQNFSQTLENFKTKILHTHENFQSSCKHSYLSEVGHISIFNTFAKLFSFHWTKNGFLF